MKIILATHNKSKLKEFKSIFENIDFFKETGWCSKLDLGIEYEPEETASDFRGNSFIKANDLWERTENIRKKDDIIISDDSGFIIDYLGGEPGIRSARYLGDISYDERFKYIIDKLKNAKEDERTCRFITTICMIRNNESGEKEVKYFEGKIEGKVAYEKRGNDGFGYDPIFYLKEYDKTVAELNQSEKNKISHRRIAINKLIEYITKDA